MEGFKKGLKVVHEGILKLGGEHGPTNAADSIKLKKEIENNFIRLGYCGKDPGRNASAIEAIKSSLYGSLFGLPNADLYDVLVNECEQSIAGYKISINKFIGKYLSSEDDTEPLSRINDELNKAWDAIVDYEKTILK